MEIINTCHQYGYAQWIEGFVSKALANANICAEKATIAHISKNAIYILVNSEYYTIHINNNIPTKKDRKGITCGEDIEYVLGIDPTVNGNREYIELSAGTISVEWSNDSKYFKSDYKECVVRYEDPAVLNNVLADNDMSFYVEPVTHLAYDVTINVQDLTVEERLALAAIFTNIEPDRHSITSKVLDVIRAVYHSFNRCLCGTCFYGEEFDINRTRGLLMCCAANKCCSLRRAIEEEQEITRLYVEYKNGDEKALDSIVDRLYSFIDEIKPYVFTTVVD